MARTSLSGVALGDIHLRFTWQVWHAVTSTCVLRGRRGTYGTGLALVARLGRTCYVKIFGDIGGLAMLVTFARDTCV